MQHSILCFFGTLTLTLHMTDSYVTLYNIGNLLRRLHYARHLSVQSYKPFSAASDMSWHLPISSICTPSHSVDAGRAGVSASLDATYYLLSSSSLWQRLRPGDIIAIDHIASCPGTHNCMGICLLIEVLMIYQIAYVILNFPHSL